MTVHPGEAADGRLLAGQRDDARAVRELETEGRLLGDRERGGRRPVRVERLAEQLVGLPLGGREKEDQGLRLVKGGVRRQEGCDGALARLAAAVEVGASRRVAEEPRLPGVRLETSGESELS